MKNEKWRMENGTSRKMKDSGIEWLGEVPEGWGLIPARNLFDEVKDKNVSGSETRQFSFRYGQIVDKEKSGRSDVTTEETITAYRIVTPDTIMINGLNLNYDFISQRVAIVKERGIITSAYLAVFPRKKLIDPAFAVYLFKGYDSKQVFHGHGSGIRKTLNFSDFKDIVTVCPPLSEQRKIATYLDQMCAKIDETIAGTKQTIEEYKAWKASLIFEAVTGKCRIENGKCRMGGRKMRDSGIPWLGEVPEGWVVKRLKYVVEIRSDSGEYSPESGHYIGLENIVSSGGYVETDTKYEQAIYARCRKGDLLYSKLRPYLAKCILSPLDAFCTGEFLVVSRYDGPMEFLRYWFLSANVTEAINASTYGSKMPRANEGFILNLPYLCPPVSVQQEIVSFLNKKCAAIDRVIAEKEALIADLEAYRKSLIFEVVTGKRSVGENGLVA